MQFRKYFLSVCLLCWAATGHTAATLGGVDLDLVRAQVTFLASDTLRGRGSGTRDEAAAATYVAAQFKAAGLRPAPGMTGYVQTRPPSPASTGSAVPASEVIVTNAIGYLPGTDPKAGVLLFTAHLDHLGVVDGVTYPGANDDASGTVAVMELARILAKSGPHRRAILSSLPSPKRYAQSHPSRPMDNYPIA